MANIIFSEGSAENNDVFGKSQEPIKMMILDRAESFEQRSLLKEIFYMTDSKHYAEKYASMTAMDGFDPVGENGEYPIYGMQEGFSQVIENETWKSSFSISAEIIEDAKLIDLQKKPNGFVKSFYRTRENFGAALFGNAINGVAAPTFRGRKFNTLAADGLSYFNKEHKAKVKTSLKQSNMYADAFSSDALAYAEEKMQNFKGDNGELVNVVPSTILIPNHAALKKTVFAAIGADKDPDTANNGYNYHFGRWNVLIWNDLNQFINDDYQPWILADLEYNVEQGGAIFQDRIPLKITSTVSDGNDSNKWKGRARFNAGFNDWRCFLAGGITGGSSFGIS